MNILILGATSSIARATAEEFAKQGAHLYLASRDTSELARVTSDIQIRTNNPNIQYGYFDAEDLSSHPNFWQALLQKMGDIDCIVVNFGYMGPIYTKLIRTETLKIITNNFAGAASILDCSLNYFITRKKGFIIGISSVAGDRGRHRNYTYCAAKAGFSTYLQGLRNFLYPYGVRVITIKPGFVDTAMNYGVPDMFLVADPKNIGKKIAQSIKQNKDIIYLPWFWRYIMLIVKSIPETLFKRLKI